MEKDFLWWRDGVIYQIYPRSFADSNNDGIGDLQGIISKLDYLQTLGVDAIWLSPIYPSPDIDFGYDVADYTAINPKFGSMDDFDQLVEQAEKRNIHIILDLVLNHTSDQHPWFIESTLSKDNPYHDWYLWRDPQPDGGPPNNWQSIFGGSGWTYDPDLDQYFFHMFYEEQPDLNWRNPEVHDAMLDNFRFWLDKGVKGFRLDVFNEYYKDALFRDNPPKMGIRGFDRQEHIYDNSQPEMYPLLKEIRTIVDQYEHSYVVGETFLADTQQTASYCGKDKLHAAFNFDFADNPWNPNRFLDSVTKWYGALSADAWPNNFLSNHDKTRAASRYCHGEDDQRAKVAAAMLLTLKGTPFIYYGEEIGLRDIPIRKKEDVKDRIGKTFWPFHKGRDGCRAPMQWNKQPYSGFSQSEPWLPVHENYPQRNVENQISDPDSLFNFFKSLIQLRKNHPALHKGDFTPLECKARHVMCYSRQWNEETIIVILNFSGRRQKIQLLPGKWVSLLEPEEQFAQSLQLTPYQVVIMENLG
jgi:alpha-glucosidase